MGQSTIKNLILNYNQVTRNLTQTKFKQLDLNRSYHPNDERKFHNSPAV